MLYNKLICFPTESTKNYLSSLFTGTMLSLDIDNLSVEVITTLDNVRACPDNMYECYGLNARVWFDSYTQISSFILTLEAPGLLNRCIELNKQGIARAFYNYYNPHLVLISPTPPLSRHYKTGLLQLANSLCMPDRPLEFSNEMVVPVDLQAPENADYNSAMTIERGLRRNEYP